MFLFNLWYFTAAGPGDLGLAYRCLLYSLDVVACLTVDLFFFLVCRYDYQPFCFNTELSACLLA